MARGVSATAVYIVLFDTHNSIPKGIEFIIISYLLSLCLFCLQL
jgi:hypothetical protein